MPKDYDKPLSYEKDFWNLTARQRELLAGNPFATDPRQAEIRQIVALERIADALESILERFPAEGIPARKTRD